jgi:hypothetical protein
VQLLPNGDRMPRFLIALALVALIPTIDAVAWGQLDVLILPVLVYAVLRLHRSGDGYGPVLTKVAPAAR